VGKALAAGLCRKVVLTLEMIKFSHSVFALPFVLASVLLAERGWPDVRVLLWIVLAMVSARSAALAFNRLVDRHFDQRNPRTQGRVLPRRVISERFVTAFTVASSAVLVGSAAMLNRWCLWLSPVALAVVLGYSYSKRFTVWCHAWLGVALGIAPAAGWIAVRGDVDRSLLAPLLMGAGVALWVTGFDLIYACQDSDFDRREGLHSIPARWGEAAALRLSAALHFGAVLCFAALIPLLDLFRVYPYGVVATAGLLVAEHRIARSRDLRRLEVAFFHVNSIVGVVYLAGVLGEVG